MIIVSQDEDLMINFDNVESIDIVTDLDGTGKVPYKICYETSSKREELGCYKTEERAKEVFKEIVKKYENSMWKLGKNILSFTFNYEFIYEMPKE